MAAETTGRVGSESPLRRTPKPESMATFVKTFYKPDTDIFSTIYPFPMCGGTLWDQIRYAPKTKKNKRKHPPNKVYQSLFARADERKQFMEVLGLEKVISNSREKGICQDASKMFITKTLGEFPRENLKDDKSLYHELCYGGKTCHFVQTVSPPDYVLRRRDTPWAKERTLWPRSKKKLYKDMPEQYRTGFRHEDMDFWAYRFWFFDLDYGDEWNLTPEYVLQYLEYVGLLPYVNAVVQTSLGKFHLYIKSQHITNFASLEYHDWSGDQRLPEPIDWFKDYESNPRASRLAVFQNLWENFNHAFGGDPAVKNGIRIAQTPGSFNFKSKFNVTLTYANRDAKVLTTEEATSLVHNALNTPLRPLLTHTPKPKPEPKVNEIPPMPKLEGVDDDEPKETPKEAEAAKKMLDELEDNLSHFGVSPKKEAPKEEPKPIPQVERIPVKSKPRRTRAMPSSALEYATHHGLQAEIPSGRNLSGRRNQALLALGRFVFMYIDPANKEQVDAYFDAVVAPYFNERVSGELSRDLSLKKQRRAFHSLCAKTATQPCTMKAKVYQIETEEAQSVYDRMCWFLRCHAKWTQHQIKLCSVILEAMAQTAVNNRHRSFFCPGEVASEKHSKFDLTEVFRFFIPVAELRKLPGVGKIAKKLDSLQQTGLLIRSIDYVSPLDWSVVRKGGESRCKEWRLFIPVSGKMAKESTFKGLEELPEEEQVDKVQALGWKSFCAGAVNLPSWCAEEAGFPRDLVTEDQEVAKTFGSLGKSLGLMRPLEGSGWGRCLYSETLDLRFRWEPAEYTSPKQANGP